MGLALVDAHDLVDDVIPIDPGRSRFKAGLGERSFPRRNHRNCVADGMALARAVAGQEATNVDKTQDKSRVAERLAKETSFIDPHGVHGLAVTKPKPEEPRRKVLVGAVRLHALVAWRSFTGLHPN
jgi:hypothetical protein